MLQCYAMSHCFKIFSIFWLKTDSDWRDLLVSVLYLYMLLTDLEL